MGKAIIKISGAVAGNSLVRMKAPIDFTLIDGESIAIVGENGAGKSLLAQILLDAVPLTEGEAQYDYENVAYVAFSDVYGSSGEDYYYQQRWNVGDTGGSPKLIYLSSGELRKFRIAFALKKRPRVLIIDNPFIGLDAGSREQFGKMLADCRGR